MPYVNPTAVSTGCLITAASWNQFVVTNMQQTFPALVTNKGDSVWATGANAGQRLGVGADGQLIVATSGCNVGVAWSGSIIVSGCITMSGSLGACMLLVGPSSISVNDGVNVGTATGASTGEVRASAYVSQQLPFVPYDTLPSNIAANKTVFMVSVLDACTIVRWAQSWFVGTTNNATNYWTIDIVRQDTGAVVATFKTSAGAADTWTRNTTVAALPVAITTGMIQLQIRVVKTLTPGNIWLGGPAVFAQ